MLTICFNVRREDTTPRGKELKPYIFRMNQFGVHPECFVTMGIHIPVARSVRFTPVT